MQQHRVKDRPAPASTKKPNVAEAATKRGSERLGQFAGKDRAINSFSLPRCGRERGGVVR